MRTYERTHPWISFTLDLRRTPASLWLKLGEAQSKCEHVAGVPLRPDTARRMHAIYMAKGVRATTAIEGNTLSEEDVLKRIEGQLELPPSKQYLGQEVDNVIAACNEIVDDIVKDRPAALDPARVRSFNALVLRGLTLPPEVRAGELRQHSVTVGRYRGAPPEDCEFLLNRLCGWLSELSLEPAGITGIAEAIIKAVLAHLYLAWIHPFGDGNGRTARLVEFQVLVGAGIPTTAAHLLSNHYNETRAEYYRQLDYASGSGGDVMGFIDYALQGLVDELTSQIKHIQKQQFEVTWRNFVHEAFGTDRTDAQKRQCQLILELSRRHGRKLVPISDLKDLSGKLAERYAGKTRKTMARDLNALRTMKLLKRVGNSVRARTEIIHAFLPVRRRVGKLAVEDPRPQSEVATPSLSTE